MPEALSIPTLETERLLLRPFTQDDFESLSIILADPEVAAGATYSGEPATRAQAWNWLCMMLGHWHLRGFGIWAVEEKDTGQFIGRIGLQLLEGFSEPELVWMLARSAWGKGYATEGVAAAIQFAFSFLDLPGISAVIKTENRPSIRLAERLCMSLEGEIDREGRAFFEYRLVNPRDKS